METILAPTSSTLRLPSPRAIFDLLARWQCRARERAQLASLDDRALADMGITRHDVAPEIEKPFWTG